MKKALTVLVAGTAIGSYGMFQYERENAKLEQKLDNLNNTIEQTTEEINKTTELNKQLQIQLDTLKQENSELHQQFEEYKMNIEAKTAYLRDVALSEDLQEYLYSLCTEKNVPYDTALAVMKTESNFNPNTVNHNRNGTKDYGLFQINEVNHDGLQKALGSLNFMNPKDNIRAGVHILSNLYNKYDSENIVLMAYNRGEGGMRKLTKQGIYSIDYTEKVFAYKSEIKETKINAY